MKNQDGAGTRARWARFRFSVIGELLASPPGHGELADRLAELSARPFRHPTTGETVHYAVPTLERWLYTARNHPRDPVEALARKLHARAGGHITPLFRAIHSTLPPQGADMSRWPPWALL